MTTALGETISPMATRAHNGCQAQGVRECDTSGSLVYTSRQDYGSLFGSVGGNEAILQQSDDASAAFLGFYKTRSTSKKKQATVHAGDDLGEINFNASDGSKYHNAASWDVSVDKDPVGSVVPTNFGFWVEGADGRHRLSVFGDSSNNIYFRHGYLGIGPHYGYEPPTFAGSGSTPIAPLSITEDSEGTQVLVSKFGAPGGGAEIRTSNGFSATNPIYAFWHNNNTGIGNPSPNTVSVMIAGTEVSRIDGRHHQSFTSSTTPTISSCGTSPQVDRYATDISGSVTFGDGNVRSCTVTFAIPYELYNHCMVSTRNATSALLHYDYDLKSIVIQGEDLAAARFDYRCDGK